MNPIILDPMTNEPVNIFQELSDSRIFFLSGIIDSNKAKDFAANLMISNLKSIEEKITIFINSPGGDIRSIYMIYDILRLISCPVEFIVIGSCEKEAVILLGAPKKVKRFATKNSILIVDQLSYNGAQFSALEDVKIIKNLLEKDNKKFIKILSSQVNKSEEQIKLDLENKKYFTSQKAIEYGLIDHIANSKEVS